MDVRTVRYAGLADVKGTHLRLASFELHRVIKFLPNYSSHTVLPHLLGGHGLKRSPPHPAFSLEDPRTCNNVTTAVRIRCVRDSEWIALLGRE